MTIFIRQNRSKKLLHGSTVLELVITLILVGSGLAVLAHALTDNIKMFKYRENRHIAQLTAENVENVVSSLDVEDFDCLLRSTADYDASNKKNFTRSDQSWLEDWIQNPITDISFDISLFDSNNVPIVATKHPNLGAITKHHRILNTTVTYKKNPSSNVITTFVSSVRMPPLDRLSARNQNSWRALRSSCLPALPPVANVPPVRSGIFSVVWTGTEAIVWGGYDHSDYTRLNTGARYNPSTDKWTTVTPHISVRGRDEHYATWTGDRMLVWGGSKNDSNDRFLNEGGLYNPIADTWTTTSTTGAPGGRCCFTGAWTGSDLIVWGGMGGTVSSPIYYNSGGVYSLTTNTWAPLPNAGILGVMNTGGVSTGTTGPSANKFIVWGGRRENNPRFSNQGVVYDLSTTPINAPSLMSTVNAPSAREDHVSVWTGTEMLIWGGNNGSTEFNTGGLYNPATNTWRATSLVNAPTPRAGMAANSQTQGIWTGKYLLIWGGNTGSSVYADGGWYDPTTNEWNKGYNPFLATWSAGTGLATKRRLHGNVPVNESSPLDGLNLPVGIWMNKEAFFFGGGKAANLYLSPSNSYGIFAP